MSHRKCPGQRYSPIIQQNIPPSIGLASLEHGLVFSSSLLQGIANFLQDSSPLTFWADVFQETIDATRSLFDLALKQPPDKTREYLSCLIPVASGLIHTSPHDTKALQPHLFRAIATRISQVPETSWNILDAPLFSALDSIFKDSILTGDFIGLGDVSSVDPNTTGDDRNVKLQFVLWTLL